MSEKSEKEERKEIRRQRIELRNSSRAASQPSSDQLSGIDGTDSPPRSPGRSTQSLLTRQIAESEYRLQQMKLAGSQEVSDLRLEIDKRESQHRAEDDALRQDRLSKLQSETLISSKKNAAIELRWGQLLDKDLPRELHQDIQEAIVECQKVIKSKDDLIAEFQKSLGAKDAEYIISLRAQSKEIDELIKRIRKDYHDMETAYSTELEAVEAALLAERERNLRDVQQQLEELFAKRRDQELLYKESKPKVHEGWQDELDQMHKNAAHQYMKLKMELEGNVQTLTAQLEEVKAIYQLNSEKLDYNYRVLTELDLEKNIELSKYKRRQNVLKDHLAKIMQKFQEIESADAKLNGELTGDYRALTAKYKNLQSKFRQFEQADLNKYDEVWAMHEEEVKDLLDQLLKADKLITEQQLGWSWIAPDSESLMKVFTRGVQAPETDTHTDSSTPGSAQSPNRRRVAGARVRAVLRILSKEAGFLLDKDVQASLAQLPDEEADFQRAEALLRALGVRNEAQLGVLVNYFFQDTAPDSVELTRPVRGFGATALESINVPEDELLLHNAPEDVQELRDIIKAEDVIRAVKAYLEDMNAHRDNQAAINSTSMEEEARIGQKRLNNMRNYWERLSQIVPDETSNVWKRLLHDYEVLRELLATRTNNIETVDHLWERNGELKALLNQYLGGGGGNNSFRDSGNVGSVGGSLLIRPQDTMKLDSPTRRSPSKSGQNLARSPELRARTLRLTPLSPQSPTKKLMSQTR